MSQKIDMTPTWLEVLPLMLEVVRHGEYDATKKIVEEFERMAMAADLWNDTCCTWEPKTKTKTGASNDEF